MLIDFMQANFSNVLLHCEVPAMTAVVVLGLLSLIPAVPLASTDQIFVRPSEDTPCPSDACYLLPHVLQNATEYLTSNTIVTLTPGHYLVDEDILTVISDVSNLTIMGSNSGSTVIVCSEQFGLVFSNATCLRISNLSFFNCCQQVTAAGLTAHYSNVTLINTNYTELVGSSIHAVHSNVKLLGKTVFDGIRCRSGCGILAYHSNVDCIGTVVFQNNSCSTGCGISASDNSNLEFLGTATFQNNTCYRGCSIAAYGNNISFNGSATFEGNKAENSGSGIFVFVRSNLEFLGTAVFRNNTCLAGCGISTSDNVNISFEGSVTFEGNKAEGSGSGIYVIFSSYLEFLGTVVFQNNTCDIGCGVTVSENSNLEFLGTAMFLNNICSSACGIAASDNTNISFNGGAILEGNKCEGTGSDICAEHSNTDILGTVVFRNNTCTYGCGITALNNANIEFLGTAVFQSNTCSIGCGILALDNINILFDESAVFEGNKAESIGSGIFLFNSSNLDFLGTAVFQNNTCYAGCGILALYNSKISFSASATFEENEANAFGGAVFTSRSTMKFDSSAIFHNNRAAQGGALYLIIDMNAALLLSSGAEINITGNYASETGGAIHIQSSTLSCRLIASITTQPFQIDVRICFYQCVNEQACCPLKVHLQDNRAEVAGNAIYGDVQKCYHNAHFEDIFRFQSFHNESDLSLIASDPTRVCFCVNGTPNCSIVSQSRTLYPGETFEIPVVVVGDVLGVTTGAALAVLPSNASLAKAQISQALQLPLCTNLTYNVYSDPGTVTMQLVTKEVQVGLLTDIGADGGSCTSIYLHLTLLPCPPGFQVDSNGACNCNQILRNHDIFNCSIDNKSVYRPDHYWISASVSGSTTVHEQCPLDYCVPHNVPIIPYYPDKQCQFNRSGTLCGVCKPNLSMVFGSSQCLPCSNWWLFLIPLFAFAGIALVFLLTVFNLTISIGTINGLIFYANIVRANTAVFFPPTQSTAVMIPSVFMAWLNLDLGIDACFYDGLDTFAKTWLQLVFPVYVWILVIGIIISSHYSTRAARLSGKNSVPVLATLFLLSFAKLLRIMIAAFSFTTLDTYNAANSSKEYVWLYDGNVQYLQGKHIPLFLAAVVILAALAAPYTLMVIAVQCLQRYRYRLLFWVRRLKPLFDAYTGPYKDRHRYWTGLLLLVRVALFLFFAVIQNVVGQPYLSLLAIIFTAVGLLVFHGMVGGVYKLVYLNLLESFFLVNLICFSGATLYTALTGGNQVAAVCTSVGLAFAVFVILVLHSAYRSLRGSRCITHFPRIRRQHHTLVAQPLTDGRELSLVSEAQVQGQHVTSQVLFFNNLREPLLEYCAERSN